MQVGHNPIDHIAAPTERPLRLGSTTYRFAKCLQQRFGVAPGVTDRNYITNSHHVHMVEKIGAFSELALEAKFQRARRAGRLESAPYHQPHHQPLAAVRD